MRTVSALFVAVVVVAAAPIGVAATAGAAPGAPAFGQIQDGGAVSQTTATNATGTETETPTATPENDTANGSDNETGTNPGAQLAGVVGVQRAEIDSEVESRSFGQQIAAAASNESKAAVVAGSLNDSRDRISELRERLSALEAARENGTISQGRYRAQTAQLTAEINSLERRVEQANETAASLPEPVRERHGINDSNIQRLREDAQNLSGPETAEIARGIAGDNPGRGLGERPAEADDAPGRSDESNRGEDAPGNSEDAPGRDDGAGNETKDRRGNGQGSPADDTTTAESESSDNDDSDTGSTGERDSGNGNSGQGAANGGSDNAGDAPGRNDKGNSNSERDDET
jgi:hypothetical protein